MSINNLKFILLGCMLLVFGSVNAQMWNGSDTIYGNEWIQYDQTYYKIRVGDDGVYRIAQQAMVDAGLPVGAVSADQFRLYRYGQQVPVFVSASGVPGPNDFIEFFGEKNRETVDRHLFADPDGENVNPDYSLFNDTTAYYLTWENGGTPLRYTSVDNNLNNPPSREPWIWFTVQNAPTTQFLKRRLSPEITYSWHDGEGYQLGMTNNRNFTLAVAKPAPGAPEAILRLRYACELGEHKQQLKVNDSIISVDSFFNWKIVDRNYLLPSAGIQSGAKIQLQSLIGTTDRNGVSLARLRYARLPELDNVTQAAFELEAASGERYLELSGINAGGQAPLVYDLTLGQRLTAVADGNLTKVVLPASSVVRRIWLSTAAAVRNVVPQPVVFRDLSAENADYIIVSNRRLFSDPTQGGVNHVEAYADYRRSAAGGNHRVVVADVDELYEQFAYGVRYHPIAIRNFTHWAEKKWDDPKYLLLIGKGVDYNGFRTPAVQAALADSLFFIPNFGSPGADLPYGMRGPGIHTPVVAIGRLAVVKPFEIRDYLDKLIAHEQELAAQPQDLNGKSWSKRVLHNCGGFNFEQLVIRNYAADMQATLEQSRFGAEVYSFYKNSNDPIQFSAYEQMVDLINSGVALWMIYGHSAAFAVDFDIGTVSSYNNKNRYPIMMVNGCFSGRCSAPQKGLGEQYILAKDRGAIAYMASVNYSFIDALYTYGKQVYERAGNEDYGKGIGVVMQNTIVDLQKSNYSALVALLHQYLLQGDPAVQLYSHVGPDYVIDPQTVRVEPNPVGLEADNYRVSFDIRNIGENTGGPLSIHLQQGLPDNTVLNRVTDTIPAPANRVALSFDVPNAGSKPGLNRFFASLDRENTIAELPGAAELNNNLVDASGTKGIDVYFYANDVQALYPQPYGIVSKPNFTFRASTYSTAAATQRYLFELDTTFRFDSPFKKTNVLQQAGGLLSWKPNVAWSDSTVYHWRVARDSLVNGVVPWRTRSFVYLAGSKPGWNQSVYGQYRDDDLINLNASDPAQQIAFSDNAANLIISLAYRNANRYMGFQNSYYEGFYGDYGWNIRGIQKGAGITMLDPTTGRFILNPPGSPWNTDTVSAKFFFWFNVQDSLQRIAMMDFIENEIPNGILTGIIAFNNTVDSVGYDPRAWAKDSISYSKNLFQVLEAQGAKDVRQLTQYTKSPWPYGFIFRKNEPTYAAWDTFVVDPVNTIEIRGTFLAKWPTGALETPLIGPAKRWGSLQWKPGIPDDPKEFGVVQLYGVRDAQTTDTLLMEFDRGTDTSLSAISVTDFPHLRLRYDALDSMNRTYTTIGYLRVLYDGIPEGAMDPAAGLFFFKDTLQQGETMRARMPYVNVSDAGMDSLLVQYRVQDANNVQKTVMARNQPLNTGDTLMTAVEFDTRYLSVGPQRLLIDVNPNDDQPEQFHFNNVWIKDFFVARDDRNPLLDVTFDGVHILDGDLVSPSPEIMVSLKDDNPYLPMTDTSTFFVSLQRPDGSVSPLSFLDPELRFYPADPNQLPKKNTARLEWRPRFTEDGNYRLLVNGRDATGNESADLDYAIGFNVVTQASLGNILNYPNPFSTSTCFVYTMTGDEPPARFNLQIMTVSGRVVREITQAEFGYFRTGTHQSDYCWDGKDQYGDQLANGVYLYRIMAKKADGSEYPIREDARIDGYFKNGFGKMVLIR